MGLCAATAALAILFQSRVDGAGGEQGGFLLHDFSQVIAGTEVQRAFTVENNSADTWVVERVRGSCSCLTAEVEPREVPPGTTLTVDCVLDTTMLRGAQTRHFQVRFEGRSPLLGQFVGDVVMPMAVIGPKILRVPRRERSFAADYTVRYPASFGNVALAVDGLQVDPTIEPPAASASDAAMVEQRVRVSGDACGILSKAEVGVRFRLLDSSGDMKATYGMRLLVAIQEPLMASPKILVLDRAALASRVQLSFRMPQSAVLGPKWRDRVRLEADGGAFLQPEWVRSDENPESYTVTFAIDPNREPSSVKLAVGEHETSIPVVLTGNTGG